MALTNYSGSKCPSCSSTSFELKEETPINSDFKLMFVRCTSCKTAIGVLEYFNTSYLVQKLAEKLNISL
jgi:uncharacterized Zn finger protein